MSIVHRQTFHWQEYGLLTPEEFQLCKAVLTKQPTLDLNSFEDSLLMPGYPSAKNYQRQLKQQLRIFQSLVIACWVIYIPVIIWTNRSNLEDLNLFHAMPVMLFGIGLPYGIFKASDYDRGKLRSYTRQRAEVKQYRWNALVQADTFEDYLKLEQSLTLQISEPKEKNTSA